MAVQDVLTEEARHALLCEIQKRGLQEMEILQIQEEQAKHTAEFDKEQKQQRKDGLLVALLGVFGGFFGRAAAHAILERRKRRS